ncbi:hypothetical protein [Emticicia sp. 17c]|uniref:hypothetical protein n=1 Tax=Emticicia sp. 17c TaxID=3127704 RepID=UPI00301BCFC4
MKSKIEEMKELYPIGSIIEGEVYMLVPFGIFLKIDHPTFMGLIEIIDIKDKQELFDYSSFPPIASKIKGRVMGYQPDNNQIYLSVKPSIMEDN